MILIALAAAAIAAPKPGDLKTFGDWTVGCDNGRACQAVGLMPADNYEAATMAVRRGAEPEAAPEIWITLAEKVPAAILVDGRRFALVDSGDTAVRPAQAGEFLQALLKGRRAALTGTDGKELAPLSIAGASAALLFMDDRQGRVGTVTALARRGSKPASAVPKPPALPVIAAAPGSPKKPRTLSGGALKAARAESACEKAEEEAPAETSRLDARHSLVLVPLRCGSGAYNFLSLAFLVDEAGRSTPARFDAVSSSGDAGHHVYNAGWDAKERRLGTMFKGRGIGDCGVTQSFAWDGARFRLAEQTEMGECRGSIDYITTWRATVR